MKLEHNKKSNLGVIFDCLLQELVESKLFNLEKKHTKLMEVFKKYFVKNPVIKEEFAIYSLISSTKYPNNQEGKELAKVFMRECLSKIDDLKYNLPERKQFKKELLEEIYSVVGKNTFFEHNVENYQTYASINTIMDYYSKNRRLKDIQDLVMLEHKLLEFVTTIPEKKETKLDSIINESSVSLDEYDIMTGILKLKTHYFQYMTENQKSLMESYFITHDDDKLNSILNEHCLILKEALAKKNTADLNDYTKERINLILEGIDNVKVADTPIIEKVQFILDGYSLMEDK